MFNFRIFAPEYQIKFLTYQLVTLKLISSLNYISETHMKLFTIILLASIATTPMSSQMASISDDSFDYIVANDDHDPIKEQVLNPYSFEIFQNTSKTKITLVLNESQSEGFTKATVRNTNGFPLIVSHKEGAIDVSGLEKGFYYVFVEYGLNQVSVQKLIKE